MLASGGQLCDRYWSEHPTHHSSTAMVFVDPFGIVFSGRGGSAAPVPARVAILLGHDDSSNFQRSLTLGSTLMSGENHMQQTQWAALVSLTSRAAETCSPSVIS